MSEEKNKGPICPCCGHVGQCFHLGDIGAGEEYYDLYVFECCECGHIDRREIFGGRMSGDNWLSECPFCGE